jgi:hypothetical protein
MTAYNYKSALRKAGIASTAAMAAVTLVLLVLAACPTYEARSNIGPGYEARTGEWFHAPLTKARKGQKYTIHVEEKVLDASKATKAGPFVTGYRTVEKHSRNIEWTAPHSGAWYDASVKDAVRRAEGLEYGVTHVTLELKSGNRILSNYESLLPGKLTISKGNIRSKGTDAVNRDDRRNYLIMAGISAVLASASAYAVIAFGNGRKKRQKRKRIKKRGNSI